MDHQIYVLPEILTDNSVVWNVHFGNIKFPAIDESHARQFADIVANAICDHTVHIADVVTHAR